MRKTNNAAKAALVAVPANVAKVRLEAEAEFRGLSRGEQLNRLSVANADDRRVMLSWLGIGQLASLAGDVVKLGASIYEAIHLKLCAEHGRDWYQVYSTPARDLGDADKARKKLIAESLEVVREGIKSGNGGDALKAADAMRKVRDWGAGKHKSKSTPNANKKQALRDYLQSWDALPSLYRRISNDEGADDTDMEMADAIAAWFTKRNINPKQVLDCKGKSEWMK
jgi:hypothetical protein